METKRGKGRPEKSYKYKSIFTGEPIDVFQHNKEQSALNQMESRGFGQYVKLNSENFEVSYLKDKEIELLKSIALVLDLKLVDLYKVILKRFISETKQNLKDNLEVKTEA